MGERGRASLRKMEIPLETSLDTRLDREFIPDDFDPLDTLVRQGPATEACSRCETVYRQGELLRGSDGALCMRCELEEKVVLNGLERRWDPTLALGATLLLVVSGGTIVLLIASSGGDPRLAVFFALAAAVSASLCSLSIVGTLRDLRFDLGIGDWFVLGKHMMALAFATIAMSANAGVFAAAFLWF